MTRPHHIVVVGAGYVGMCAAHRLLRRLRRGEAIITVIDPESYMTYQPFLPEAAAGDLEPRHVVVSLRRVLRRARVVVGRVTAIEPARRSVTFVSVAGDKREIAYDSLIVSPGSVPRTVPIPGLADYGIGFTSVGEAVYLRNHVLSRLDLAVSTEDGPARDRALSFLFVGGGYAGVEALGELNDMACAALDYFDGIGPGEMRWHLVELTGRILPEVSEEMGRHTVDLLRRRGIDVHLNTRLESAAGGHMVLSDGTEFDADTLVWTAGIRPNPLIAASGLPRDDKGRLLADAFLRVSDRDGNPVKGVWTAGDCAAVPDLTKGPGNYTSPSAQHAVRQARRLADNLVATLRGQEPRPYRHSYAGSVAGLGRGQGVAEIYGIKLDGWPAWALHRIYHASRMPTVDRKTRIVADWALDSIFPREVISLGELHQPRAQFAEFAAAKPG